MTNWSSPVTTALDAIDAQLHEMRSLKGWRLNLIRENLTKVRAALDAGVAQTPVPSLETKIRAQTRVPLIKIAATCHRSKWQFDYDEEKLLPVAEARRLARKAFDVLHSIGDMANKAAEALRSDDSTVSSTHERALEDLHAMTRPQHSPTENNGE